MKEKGKKSIVLFLLAIIFLLLVVGSGIVYVISDRNDVVINELDNPYVIADYIPQLEPADLLEMNMEEVCDYYGVDVFPSYIPKDLQLSTNFPWGIYENESRGVYWNQQFINYEGSEENGRNIHIVVDKENDSREMWVGYVDLFEETDLEKSIIKDVEVLLGHYVCEDFEEYCAEFVYKGVDFYVDSFNIAEDEFVDVIESLLSNGDE